jgi:23S rRNA (uracil1939-C5)-methyltransferase
MKTQNNATTEATIERLNHEGRGVAKIDGKTTFIDNALVGETVHFKYIKKHRKYDEGVAIDILQPSSDRVTPQCSHFLTCGGCRLQHFSSDAQIAFKQATLLEQFTHFAQLTPTTILPPLTGKSYGYRRKARFGVRFVTKKEKVLVGFHEINGRYIADISSCAVLDPSVSNLIEPLKNCLMTLENYRDIPQIEVAVGDQEKAFVFRHLNALSEHDLSSLIEFGQTYEAAIYLQPGNLKTTHQVWPTTGEERLSYTLQLPAFTERNLSCDKTQLTLKFHPQDFIQVNKEINQQLAEQVISWLALSSEDVVLDLFCGLGNFTLPIACYANQVVGIEGDSMMVDRAAQNAQANHLTNAHFFQHDLTIPFNDQSWAKNKFNKILLDPPRSGAKEILASVAALKPTRIVYISCNPATLARDAGELVHQYGFKLLNVGVMDMFPQTCHVESMAIFER